MYEVSVYDLQDGDILARPIIVHNGITILNEGTVLTKRYRKRLIERGITRVFIKRLPTANEHSHASSAAGSNQKKFIVEQLVTRLENKTNSLYAIDDKKERVFKQLYRQAISEIVQEPQLVEQLWKLYQSGAYAFHHSCHVSIMSCLIGTHFVEDQGSFSELALGSLLYDVGMTELPFSMSESRPLTEQERELLRRHPVHGYHSLKKAGVSERSAQCALYHHERYDGSGYPYQLRGAQIPVFAQIVGMCDIYNALISARPHRMPFTEEDALELFYAAGNYYFHADLVKVFVKQIKEFGVQSANKPIEPHFAGTSHSFAGKKI